MLKHAIEKSPEDLQKILKEVLNLPRATREQLAELLEDTSLGVANRCRPHKLCNDTRTASLQLRRPF